MKTIVVIGTGVLERVISYGLNKLGYEVIISGESQRDASAAKCAIEAAGGTILQAVQGCHAILPSLYPQAVVSSNMGMTAHCMRLGIPCADLSGNPTFTATLIVDAKKVAQAPVFVNLGLVPNWNERIENTRACHYWSKFQKALGFPAAAAVGSMAAGHLPRRRGARTYADIPVESYIDNLKLIERPIWKGIM